MYKDENGALKEPSWKLIEYHTLELGLHNLYCMDKFEDNVKRLKLNGLCHCNRAKTTRLLRITGPSPLYLIDVIQD